MASACGVKKAFDQLIVTTKELVARKCQSVIDFKHCTVSGRRITVGLLIRITVDTEMLKYTNLQSFSRSTSCDTLWYSLRETKTQCHIT